MSSIYCHSCSVLLGLFRPELPDSLTGTSYQLAKYIKHTAPTGTYPYNSIFEDTGFPQYMEYIVTATVSGSAQLDDRGRVNLLYLAGREIGLTYAHGELLAPADAILVVFHDNQWKIHGFPVDSRDLVPSYCANCGAPIFT
ncbi:MAG: hypothetical protein ABSG98_06180 [Anaerolineales bacterium]|jgi:hypothetical protein